MAKPLSDRVVARGFRELLAAVVILAGVMAPPALAADAQVKIANFTFDPPTLTVKAATTVTWINADDIPHLVSEKDGEFRSSALLDVRFGSAADIDLGQLACLVSSPTAATAIKIPQKPPRISITAATGIKVRSPETKPRPRGSKSGHLLRFDAWRRGDG